MDYRAAVDRIYSQVEHDEVGNAVLTCLRVARHMKDCYSTAIFLRESSKDKKDPIRILMEDFEDMPTENVKYFWDKSFEDWLREHDLGFNISKNEDGEDRTVLSITSGEIDSEIRNLEESLEQNRVPVGMTPIDTAYFEDETRQLRAFFAINLRAVRILRDRIKTRCFNYAVRIEKQLRIQHESESFLAETQRVVNNYFSAMSPEVLAKLQRASELVLSNNPEDHALSLTVVRRTVELIADHFYPPAEEPVICSDGKKRHLGEKEYLNRLQEYLGSSFSNSSSNELLKREFDCLATFVRRLNDLASKGVHSEVSSLEARQGIMGLYMFLHNLISKLQNKTPNKGDS